MDHRDKTQKILRDLLDIVKQQEARIAELEELTGVTNPLSVSTSGGTVTMRPGKLSGLGTIRYGSSS